MAYDAASAQVVLFGGNEANYTWIFQNGTWTNLTTPETPPGGTDLTMAYDAAIRAVVLVPLDGTTWTFANNSWTQQHPLNSLGSRHSRAFFFNQQDGGMIFWGGIAGGPVTNETWEYRADNWTQLAPPTSPPAGQALGSAEDTEFNFGVVLGIVSGTGATADNTTWTFANGTWSNVTATFGTPLPASAGYPGLGYDSTDGYVIEFGGNCACSASAGQTWILRDPLILNVTASARVRDLSQTVNYSIAILGGIMPYSVSYPTMPPGCLQPTNYSVAFTLSCSLNETGAYSFTVHLSDAYGSKLTLVFPLQVNADPTVKLAASPNPTTAGIPVHLGATIGGGTAPSLGNWSIADGPSGTALDLNVTFAAPGSYPATYGGVDGAGYPFNATVEVEVNPAIGLSATLSSNVTDVGFPILLSATASGGTPRLAYSWAFGDGETASTNISVHSYGAPGRYSPRVWANDSVGGVRTTTLQIQVNPDLTANATVNASKPIQNGSVAFRTVVAGGTGPDTYWWSFGDGTSSHSADPTHSYSVTGPRTATLRVNDSVGGNQTVQIPLDVVAPATVNTSVPPPPSGSSGISTADLVVSLVGVGVIGIAVGVLFGRVRRPPPPTEEDPAAPVRDP
ncbi:MAG: PKD domain-containing protein [Thermoplasmata archaeon]|nr:PKD domain-containing protein [Thermoplasmata archaeon]